MIGVTAPRPYGPSTSPRLGGRWTGASSLDESKPRTSYAVRMRAVSSSTPTAPERHEAALRSLE
jgi:hypothetical protein